MFSVKQFEGSFLLLDDGIVHDRYQTPEAAVAAIRDEIMQDLAQEARRLQQQLMEVQISWRACNDDHISLKARLASGTLLEVPK